MSSLGGFPSPLTIGDHQAREAFDRALRRGRWQYRFARLSGRAPGLERFDSVRRGCGALLPRPQRREDIPLAAISGSVGRSGDYTAAFLPRIEQDERRWSAVYRRMVDSLEGLPPIEVIRLGDRYYVADGHHRVSVARWLGHGSIEAFVTEVQPIASAPRSAGDSPRRRRMNPRLCPV